MGITHAKVSNKTDGNDSSLVRPSDWNAEHTITSPLTVASSTNNIGLNVSGTITSTAGQVYPFGQGNYFLGNFTLTDDASLTGGSPNYSGAVFAFQDVDGGKHSDAYTCYATCYLSEDFDSSPAHATYVGGVFQSVIGASRGGTAGTKRGLVEGISAAVIGLAGSNYLAIQTAEFANSLASGVTCEAKTILTLALLSGDAQQGSTIDTMLHFAENSVGAVGYQHAMRIGAVAAACPLTTTGTLFECFGTGAIKSGFDISGYTFTDYAFRSPGFNVNGSGAVTCTGTFTGSGSNFAMELGNTGAVNTPVIDFHSGGSAVDYDTRLISLGGSTSAGTGALFLIGSFGLSEMTAPSAPTANNVLLYAEDNGGGKTRLMALFSSGAAQQVAIQP